VYFKPLKITQLLKIWQLWRKISADRRKHNYWRASNLTTRILQHFNMT